MSVSVELSPANAARVLSKILRRVKEWTPDQQTIINTAIDEIHEYDNHPLFGGAVDHHNGEGKFDYALLKKPTFIDLVGFTDRMIGSHWKTEEVDVSGDLPCWNALPEKERLCIEKVLAFFAVGDTVVKDVLGVMADLFPIPEVEEFIANQIINEMEHQKMYNIFLEVLVPDQMRLKDLLNAYKDENFKPIKRKFDWMGKYMSVDNDDLGEFVVGQICTEAIMFAASFALLLKFEAPAMAALTKANEFIRRDESLHFTFYNRILELMPQRPSDERIREILKEATDVELEFAKYAVPETGVERISRAAIINHVLANTNMTCELMGVDPLYLDAGGRPVMSDLAYMNTYESELKSNFFECRSTDYNTKWVRPRI